MRVTLEGNMLQVNVVDLFEGLSADNLAEIADSLAVTDQVIDQVVKQILEGWTDLGSHAGKSHHAPAVPYAGLDKAIRDVASKSSFVAKAEIVRLEEALLYQTKRADGLSDELAALRRRRE